MSKKLKEVVEGDFRFQDFEEEAQRWLLKIEALKKRTPQGQKVKLEDLEKLIIMMTKKYSLRMQWINLTIIKGELPWYSVSITNTESHEWLKTIYGLTIYELYAKVALFMFAMSRERKSDKNG